MRKVPDLVAAEVARMRADGVPVSDDDLVWLASLGAAVENPRGQTPEAAGAHDSIRLSDGTVLRPLTLRAEAWLARFGPAFEDRADLFAVAYALSHPSSLPPDCSARKAVALVLEWAGGLEVARAELAGAVARMMRSDEPRNPEAKPVTTEEVIALLTAATGLPAEHWMAQSWATVDATHAGVMRWASMLSLAGGDPDAAESKSALKRLALAIQVVREKGKADGDAKGN
jgi:hypothetical protein